MPPRYAYWTIIAGGLPTAFRATERDELLPTFQRIREKHPDAEMKWFARGKLWESPEAARIRRDDDRGRRPFSDARPADERNRNRGAGPSTPDRRDGPSRPPGERRGRDWRPGGEHRDPRQKFVDAKKQKNAALRKDRWERKNTTAAKGPEAGGRAVSRSRPQGNSFRESRPWERKPFRGQGTAEPPQPPKPRGPNREPRRNQTPEPTPPPRPDEPVIPPPGPPERGHIKSRRPFRPRHQSPKGPRR
jgi:hypothetical protein